MKLRNKKTGEIVELFNNTDGILPHTLAKLNEDWEDYKPAEPLIKDEKIRKAVRAWAEASNMNEALCEPLPKSVCFRTNCNEGYGNCMFLEFKEGDKKPNGWHTIAELCGEEEE